MKLFCSDAFLLCVEQCKLEILSQLLRLHLSAPHQAKN